MPVQTMQAVAEHQLFKAALPIVAAALIGSVTWLFVTVLSLDKDLHLVTESHVTDLEEDMREVEKKIENLNNTMTDLRIRFAELASPGHPLQRSSKEPYNNSIHDN